MTNTAKMTEPRMPTPAPARMRMWDLPVRLFHWSLVLLLSIAWWTAEERAMEWHRLAGYAILGLLLFRLGWGIWGSTTARFRHFVKGPRAVIGYASDLLHRRAHFRPGHNPLGGWSVIALLGLVAAQILLGLFAVDIDGLESGPLSYLVDFDTGRLAAETHALLFNILAGFIGLHVFAILFHRIHGGENLVAAMVHGQARRVDDKGEIGFASNWLALLTLASVALAVWVLVADAT